MSDLVALAAQNGLALTPEQGAQLTEYGKLLIATNANVNLISRKDEANLSTRHLLHSLVLAMPSVAGFVIPEGAAVFDIGCGGGLPGIPLAIARPDLAVTLCDSIAKKIAAVQHFLTALQLTRASAVCARAESLEKLPAHRAHYDVIVSRATAPLDELVTWTRPLAKRGATLLALKGGDLAAEIARTRALPNIGGAITETTIRLVGWPDFTADDKKVVRVTLA